MNILLTGGTNRQVGIEDPLYDLINIPREMFRSLYESGHRVHWGHFPVGSTDPYDARLVSIAPIGVKHSAAHVLGSYLALATDQPCILYFDDYQLDLVMAGAKAILDHGVRSVLDEKFTYGDSFELFEDAALVDGLYNVCGALYTGEWPSNWGALIPAYSWGDKFIVSDILKIERSRLAWVDPSFTAIGPANSALIDRPHNINRRRAWFLPALNDHSTWVALQGPDWPVITVGQYTVGIRLKSEADVAGKYNDFIGALAPPYPQSGSGWFRSRYVYSALGGSILVGDPSDALLLGNSFAHSIRDVEDMSDDELRALARAQQGDVLPRLGSRLIFQGQLEAVLQSAVAGTPASAVNA